MICNIKDILPVLFCASWDYKSVQLVLLEDASVGENTNHLIRWLIAMQNKRKKLIQLNILVRSYILNTLLPHKKYSLFKFLVTSKVSWIGSSVRKTFFECENKKKSYE